MNERGLLAQGQKVMTIKTGDITEKLCTIEANLGSIFERVEAIKRKVGVVQKDCEPTAQCAPQTIYGYAERLSRENAVAITKMEEALMWLRKRTMGREAREVVGTSNI